MRSYWWRQHFTGACVRESACGRWWTTWAARLRWLGCWTRPARGDINASSRSHHRNWTSSSRARNSRATWRRPTPVSKVSLRSIKWSYSSRVLNLKAIMTEFYVCAKGLPEATQKLARAQIVVCIDISWITQYNVLYLTRRWDFCQIVFTAWGELLTQFRQRSDSFRPVNPQLTLSRCYFIVGPTSQTVGQH